MSVFLLSCVMSPAVALKRFFGLSPSGVLGFLVSVSGLRECCVLWCCVLCVVVSRASGLDNPPYSAHIST